MDNTPLSTACLQPIPSSDYRTICQLSQKVDDLSVSLAHAVKEASQACDLEAQLRAQENELQAKIEELHLPSFPIECTVWLRSTQEPICTLLTCALQSPKGAKKLWSIPI